MGIKNAGAVLIPCPIFPVICEPEPTRLVENEVIRSAQRDVAGVCVERFDLARFEVYPFDAPTLVILSLLPRENASIPFNPVEAPLLQM